MAARLDRAEGVAALELNISCPNVKEGGIAFSASPEAAVRVTAAVRDRTRLPLIVKLSPNTGDIAAMARAVEAAGADAISVINTLVGLAIDAERARPVLGNTFGGLSGPAVKPVALAMTWNAARAVRIPVIGMGGITTGRDAVEFLMAGASAVAVGTATFVDPLAPVRVIDGIAAFMAGKGVARVGDLVGAAWPERRGARPW